MGWSFENALARDLPSYKLPGGKRRSRSHGFPVIQADDLALDRYRRLAVVNLVPHERVQDGCELLAGAIQPFEDHVQLREPPSHVGLVNGGEYPLFRAEVVHDRALGDPQLGRDHAEVHVVVADLGDVPGEGLQDLVVAPGVAGHPRPLSFLALGPCQGAGRLHPAVAAPSRFAGQLWPRHVPDRDGGPVAASGPAALIRVKLLC